MYPCVFLVGLPGLRHVKNIYARRILMKRIASVLALTWAAFAPQWASAADVGVSISVGQPGFYGQIDIGNVARPQLIYAQPVWVQRTPVQVAPIYLRVSPGHEKNWSKHCKHYDACGRPVYFVRDDWYRNTYVPAYRERGEGRGGYDSDRRGGEHDRKDRDHGKNGNGHGKGHDKGHDRD